MKQIFKALIVLGIIFPLPLSISPVKSGEADVVDVAVREISKGKWRFDVTVRHADTGWEHYANRWDVVAPDNTVLGTRVLAHPHVNEQPFTRSATINIPEGIDEVIVRANDLVDGLGGKEVRVKLPR